MEDRPRYSLGRHGRSASGSRHGDACVRITGKPLARRAHGNARRRHPHHRISRTRSLHETDAGRLRVITDAELIEVSIVRKPAYRSSELDAGKMRIDAFEARLEMPTREECA
ncbi:MAG: hypothetical protein EOP21_02310 [Hyphomicrobiales bacterium]|nr:MAG: hypothetical protein EOP21_02310 [Hyphomicrobiales bacterium]